MDVTPVVVAAIGATPPTIALLLRWRQEDKRAAVMAQKIDGIDRAVNHRPIGEPTLIEKVDGLQTCVSTMHEDVRDTKERVVHIEKVVGIAS